MSNLLTLTPLISPITASLPTGSSLATLVPIDSAAGLYSHTSSTIQPVTELDPAAAISEWLKPIKWQHFLTLELPWSARPATAIAKFSSMLNKLERAIRTRACVVHGAETRSKSGATVPLHFHAAMTAVKPIPAQLIVDLWLHEVGRDGATTSASGEVVVRKGKVKSDLALVVPYNPALNGIGYIMKQVQDDSFHWDTRNINLLTPPTASDTKQDHAALRAARRLVKQAA
jgi:hypothetical protein